MAEDYNHIKDWLDPLLDERGLTIEEFANLCGISRAAVYFYRSDRYRPDEGTMVAMCAALEVPLEEGLRQYTPRPTGRPGRHHLGRK